MAILIEEVIRPVLDIQVDKASDIPVYRQIIEQITSQVQAGLLKAGDRLPAERELAVQLDVARGTVNKAYEELERSRVVESVRGSGSYVSDTQNVLPQDRKRRAIDLIDGLLQELEAMGIGARETGTLVQLRIMERQATAAFRIAGVDCNPEALATFRSQLAYMSNVSFTPFLLDQLSGSAEPEALLDGFDLIVTTTTHYGELQALLPHRQTRLVRAAVSPSQQTIIDLATVPTQAKVGVICASAAFQSIIRSHLKAFDISLARTTWLLTDILRPLKSAARLERMRRFLRRLDTLILPQALDEASDPEFALLLADFRQGGGRIIRFDYQIERGSLMHLEEQIASHSGLGGK